MSHTVTLHALRPGLGEIVVTVHKIDNETLSVYTAAPGVTLAAVRTIGGDLKADGFRVTDDEGRLVVNYRDEASFGQR